MIWNIFTRCAPLKKQQKRPSKHQHVRVTLLFARHSTDKAYLCYDALYDFRHHLRDRLLVASEILRLCCFTCDYASILKFAKVSAALQIRCSQSNSCIHSYGSPNGSSRLSKYLPYLLLARSCTIPLISLRFLWLECEAS